MTDAELIQLLKVRLQETIDENDKLRAENESLKAGLGAHEYLRASGVTRPRRRLIKLRPHKPHSTSNLRH